MERKGSIEEYDGVRTFPEYRNAVLSAATKLMYVYVSVCASLN